MLLIFVFDVSTLWYDLFRLQRIENYTTKLSLCRSKIFLPQQLKNFVISVYWNDERKRMREQEPKQWGHCNRTLSWDRMTFSVLNTLSMLLCLLVISTKFVNNSQWKQTCVCSRVNDTTWCRITLMIHLKWWKRYLRLHTKWGHLYYYFVEPYRFDSIRFHCCLQTTHHPTACNLATILNVRGPFFELKITTSSIYLQTMMRYINIV